MTAMVTVNGEAAPLVASVMDLLRASGVDPEARGVAVAVNGTVVPRRDWPASKLAEGDEVEIVKPFAGG